MLRPSPPATSLHRLLRSSYGLFLLNLIVLSYSGSGSEYNCLCPSFLTPECLTNFRICVLKNTRTQKYRGFIPLSPSYERRGMKHTGKSGRQEDDAQGRASTRRRPPPGHPQGVALLYTAC